MPSSLEAERAVLGGLMLDPGRLDEVAEVLQPDAFYREAHKRLFQLMLDMGARGEPTEMVAVVERVMAQGAAEVMGGLPYISALPDNVPSTENLLYYAGVVQDRAVRRRLLEACQKVAGRVYAGEDELAELLDGAEGQVLAVTREGVKTEQWERAGTTVRRVVHEMREQSRTGQERRGVPTGFRQLDLMLGGLQPQQFVVLAARPSQGKTACLLAMARHAAESGVGVGLVSMETSKDLLMKRLLAQVSCVPFERLRRACLSRKEWAQVAAAEDLIASWPIFIDDSPGMTVQQLRTNAMRLKRDHPEIGLWGTDYIQLMVAKADARSREQVVAASARGLKNLAMELKNPWIGLSQLARKVEERPNKRPTMGDLRESGEIEQAADVILGLYRPAYYEHGTAESLTAEIIVIKQKDGPTGTVKVLFYGPTMSFIDPAQTP